MNPENQLSIPLPTETSRWKNLSRTIRTISRKPFNPGPYWRTQAFAYTVVSSLVINLGLLMYSVLNYDDLSPKLRFFYDAPTETTIQLDKSIAIYTPLVVFGVQLLVMFILNTVHRYDRRLAAVINVVLILQNVIVILAGIQILSLST